ncbi:IS110 family transposase [Saccharopolyspora erythraea]|uniref:IS110 family transposase n=1 Tax=Saccharopolyspora erythraea TaxID=1836 RepID=UPI0001D30F6D
MVILGVDAHKRTHTVVAIDSAGRQPAAKTVGTTTKSHLALLRWAVEQGEERLWAIEDCRHLSRGLERDLLAAGEDHACATEAHGTRTGFGTHLWQVRSHRRTGCRTRCTARA